MEALKEIDVISSIEQGFIDFSNGKVVVPPVGEMIFQNPPGDAHIKYGYIKDSEYFVIKIATGFYENINKGLSSSNGLMLVFSQKTGFLKGTLFDEGNLTDHRTAAAGAITAKYLAPEKVHRIGVFGAGIQGKLQLQYLKGITKCRKATVWGLDEEELSRFVEDTASSGYEIKTTLSPEEVAAQCNLIVTATPSTKPLLMADQIRPGTHITAIGSDTPEKIELDPKIISKADVVVVDSISQSQSRGEVFRATQAERAGSLAIQELGYVISNKKLGRTSQEQITIADLTGVAVQDIQIATEVFNFLSERD